MPCRPPEALGAGQFRVLALPRRAVGHEALANGGKGVVEQQRRLDAVDTDMAAVIADIPAKWARELNAA